MFATYRKKPETISCLELDEQQIQKARQHDNTKQTLLKLDNCNKLQFYFDKKNL